MPCVIANEEVSAFRSGREAHEWVRARSFRQLPRRVLSTTLMIVAAASAAATGLKAAPDTIIELVSPAAQGLDVPVKLGVPALVTEIRIRNTGREPDAIRRYSLGPTLLRTADRKAVPATWTRLDRGDGDTVAPGTELILQLSANLTEPGAYEVWIDTETVPGGTAPAQPDRRVHVVVTREIAGVPTDLIVDPKPMELAPWPWDPKAKTIFIAMSNVTPKPVEFAPPAILAFGVKSGDVQKSAAARLPVLEPGNCVSPLGAGQRCAMQLTVGGHLPPGQYSVDIGTGGPGGGFSPKTALFSVRLPLLVAFVVTALGAGAGWLVQAWRSSGRRAFGALIALGELRSRTKACVDANPALKLGDIAAPLLFTASALESKGRSGDDVVADIAALSTRVECLETFASVERAFKPMPAEAQVMMEGPHTHFAQQASAAIAGQAVDGLGTLAAAMVGIVNGWPCLSAARKNADAQLALLRRLQNLAEDDAAQEPVVAAITALQSAMTGAMAKLPSDAGAAVTRNRSAPLEVAVTAAAAAQLQAIDVCTKSLGTLLAIRLKQNGLSEAGRAKLTQGQARLQTLDPASSPSVQISLLEQLWPLKDSAPDTVRDSSDRGGVEGMSLPSAMTPGLDLPVAAMFGLVEGMSVKSLQREQWVLEVATNMIILIAISLSGAVLVGGNAAWGSSLDIISLLLAGFASRVTITALAAITQPAASGH